jgi:hypothetical protein
VNLGMSASAGSRPVRNRCFSTVPVHGRKRVAEPRRVVFPVVHTLYHYNERF